MRKQGNKCSVQSSLAIAVVGYLLKTRNSVSIIAIPSIPVAIIYITHIRLCLTTLTAKKALEKQGILLHGKARGGKYTNPNLVYLFPIIILHLANLPKREKLTEFHERY